MKLLLKNPAVRKILSALAIVFFGYILLNLTFILDALYQGIIRNIVGRFLPLGPDSNLYWFPPLMHGSFMIMIGLISGFVFKAKLKTLYKAVYLSVPVAVVLVTIGMFLSHWSIILYLFGSLLVLGTLYYFYYKKLSWLYYFTVIFWSAVLTVFTLLGGEI